ncbi:nitronate monooxygenase [Dechloromonas sp. ZY10]|uniref:NAD(P)H-dependent flavin oxidoreductase n=1 Tax=Dechloromonas aquae TaxID=2664436 RepID=UPI003526FC65
MTPLQQIGCALPIVQAPMAGVQDSGLAIAVGLAGGLGSLPAAMLELAALEHELQTLDRHLGRRYNLNFFAHAPNPPTPERETAWQQLLSSYYAEYGCAPPSGSPSGQRQPFSDPHAVLVERYRPAVVSFHFGLPAGDLLRRVKDCGAQVWSSATTVEEARWLEQRGVDAIIAQGLEAGGHRGMFLSERLDDQLGSFALLPQIVDAVRIPVIAAGGIVGPAEVRAAMALGACAIQAGTVYLCSDEAGTSALHRAALQSPVARHTALTNLFSGRPARGIINRLMREHGPLQPAAPAFPHASAALAPLRAAAEAAGKDDFTPLWCGQHARCPARPATEITRWLAGLEEETEV